MPTIGETKQVYSKESRKQIWVKCPACGLERWVQERAYLAGGSTGICKQCGFQAKRGFVKRGRKRYVRIRLLSSDFFYQMADKKGFVYEHRLVVAKALGRNLHRWEIVHHKNGNSMDNRYPGNLQLVTDDRHTQITMLENRIKYLEDILTRHHTKF